MDRHLLRVGLAILFMVGSACAGGPAASPTTTGSTVSGTPPGPKVLTIAIQREPSTFEGFNGMGGSSGGVGELKDLAHAHLTVTDPFDEARPQLATELPAVDKGTWQVFPDGSMEMTWKLRSGVKWQDGAPFTSADLAFSLQLHKDRDLAHAYGRQTRIMESATTPDPLTFVVRWSQVDVRALEARALTPMPKHLLEELYLAGDKDSFVNSPRFTTEFIGLGAYRLTNWERGSQLELTRFDDYFLGRPPLDKVIARIIPDASAMTANILAEAVDLVLPPSIETDAAFDLKRRWEGTANVVRAEPIPRFAYLELQFRPETARPLYGPTVLAVRQALLHAIDRVSIAEAITTGMGPVADSWIRPDDPLRPQIEPVITKYPYDKNRALQLLAQAGWERGAGGILTHTSGERFEIELWNNPQTSDKTATIMMDNWREIGVDPKLYIIPPARSEDREHTTQHPGPLLTGTFLDQFLDRYDGRDISSAANRWSGRNRAAYINPQADALLQRLQATVDARERLPIIKEHVQIMMADLAYMPLYWEARVILALKSVKGDIHPYNSGWNANSWDKQ